MSLQAEDPIQVAMPGTGGVSKKSAQSTAPKKPGRFAQIRQVFTAARAMDPMIGWWMALAALGALIVMAAIGVLVKHWVYFLVLGIPLAALAASVVMNMKLKRISAARQVNTGRTGGVLEVTDVNGVRVRIPASGGVSPSTNGFAIVSLITALVGLGGVLAVIFGHIAHSQIRRTGERGWGMATAGLIIGYIGIVVGVAVAIVYFYALSRL